MKKTTPKDMNPRRVVVTGLGVLAPNGIGLDRFWRNTMAGVSGVREVDRFPLDGFKARIAGLIDDFDAAQHGLSREQQERLDRYVQFALAAARMALADASLPGENLDHARVGVNIATAICGTRFMEEHFRELTRDGREQLDPTLARQALYYASTFNVASAETASAFGFRGPCCSMSTGCTAGLDAMGFGLDAIRKGQADVMIVGASEAPITPITMAAFDVIGALSPSSNGSPKSASRPFDRERDGFVLAEGCAVLVLEELCHARRRGARIYAELRGFGSSCNAYHMTDLPADGRDMASAIDLALADAGVAPDEIDYVSAHGSSTPQNDVNETNALKLSLGRHAYKVRASSLKSMNGHPLSAANAVESVLAVLAIRHKQVPPTINYRNRDPNCDLDYVPNEGIEADVDVVLKTASGFSGIHSAAIFSAYGYEGGMQ